MMVGGLAFVSGWLRAEGELGSYARGGVVTTIGAAVGTAKQQTTYAVIGGAVSGHEVGAITTYLGKLYSKANAGEGLSETDRLRRQMVIGQTTSVFSSLAGKFADGWRDKQDQYNMENGNVLSQEEYARPPVKFWDKCGQT